MDEKEKSNPHILVILKCTIVSEEAALSPTRPDFPRLSRELSPPHDDGICGVNIPGSAVAFLGFLPCCLLQDLLIQGDVRICWECSSFQFKDNIVCKQKVLMGLMLQNHNKKILTSFERIHFQKLLIWKTALN